MNLSDALLLAQQPAGPSPSITSWVVALAFLSLTPFLFTLVTSFAKIVIVGGIIRQAIGTPQIPPTMVITGIALILTLHIMSPVIEESLGAYQQNYNQFEDPDALTNEQHAQLIYDSAYGPMRRFLERHAHPENIALFERMQGDLRAAHNADNPDGEAAPLDPAAIPGGELAEGLLDDFVVLVPAFLLSELTEAFQIGFLIFIPFLIIDLVVSNILLSMGMHMLSPTTIALPFKLLLFVLIDGWRLILEGVVSGYI